MSEVAHWSQIIRVASPPLKTSQKMKTYLAIHLMIASVTSRRANNDRVHAVLQCTNATALTAVLMLLLPTYQLYRKYYTFSNSITNRKKKSSVKIRRVKCSSFTYLRVISVQQFWQEFLGSWYQFGSKIWIINIITQWPKRAVILVIMAEGALSGH